MPCGQNLSAMEIFKDGPIIDRHFIQSHDPMAFQSNLIASFAYQDTTPFMVWCRIEYIHRFIAFSVTYTILLQRGLN